MDNIYRLSNLISPTEAVSENKIFNWRSELYDCSDNTYFLLAKFTLLNKIKFEQTNEFFSQYFSFDIYDLDCEAHRSVKYFFAIYSRTPYKHSDFITSNLMPTNILGMNINMEYSYNLTYKDKIIRYCPECIKAYKLPEQASFDYIDRCPIHKKEFREYFFNHQGIPLRERNIKCYEKLIKALCPRFPENNNFKITRSKANSSIFNDLSRWNISLNKEYINKYGDHIHLFKVIETGKLSDHAYSVLLKSTKLQESLLSIFKNCNLIRKIDSVTVPVDIAKTLFSDSESFHIKSLLLVYSSFCLLHRKDEAVFVRTLLNFINEIKFMLINKTEKYWYLNKNYGHWTLSDWRYRNCDAIIHDLLIEWLIENWFPPMHPEIRRRGNSYFTDFYLMNHNLVQLGICTPLIEPICDAEINVAYLHLNGLKFQELSRPNFTADQLSALDIVMNELAKSYIHDARVWLADIESGQEPEHFPPRSRSLLALQKVHGQYRLFNAQID